MPFIRNMISFKMLLSIGCTFSMLFASTMNAITLIGFADEDSNFAVVNTWTNMNPSLHPPARSQHAMAYDSKSDRIILFGGDKNGHHSFLGDTWAYDYNTNTWTNMSPKISPSARDRHAMVYDSRSDRIILFGGYNGNDYLNDTWSYNYNTNTWTNMTQFFPGKLANHGMAYDSESDGIIVFGGGANQTWSYDYSNNTWTEMKPKKAPYFPSSYVLAYDSESDRIIAFDGFPKIIHTWIYDYNTNTWTNVSPSFFPGPLLQGYAMVYDSQSDRVVLFGGVRELPSIINETWQYDYNTNTWKNVSSDVRPPERASHAMAYDSKSDHVILFGGSHAPFVNLDDTWVYGPEFKPNPQISNLEINLSVVLILIVILLLCIFFLMRKKRKE